MSTTLEPSQFRVILGDGTRVSGSGFLKMARPLDHDLVVVTEEDGVLYINQPGFTDKGLILKQNQWESSPLEE